MFAQATGPSSLTSLGSVKSSVTVAMSNGTSAGSSPGQYVRAQPQAIYLDYLRLIPGQVSNVQIDFALTGSLSLNDPPQVLRLSRQCRFRRRCAGVFRALPP